MRLIFEWDALCCQQHRSIFSLFFSCEVNIGYDMWIAEMHNHRLFWMLYELPGLSVWLQCTWTLKSSSNFLYSLCSFLLLILDLFQVDFTLWMLILFSTRLVKVEILWLHTKLICRLKRTGGSSKQGDHPGNNASTYCFACSSNASDTRIQTNQIKFIHEWSDFI